MSSTRATLSEELWVTRRPKDAATALSVVPPVAAVVSWSQRVAIGSSGGCRNAPVQMALTVAWEQVVR